MIAYAFLQHRRLTKMKWKKRINGPVPQPSLPALGHAIVKSSFNRYLSDARFAEDA
jgi:hypothetical protein